MSSRLILLLGVLTIALGAPVHDANEKSSPTREAPERRAASPVVTISAPDATITGKLDDTYDTVEIFPGVPFAQPPVGPLRLKPPQPITQSLGQIEATKNAPACPQFFLSTDSLNDGSIPTSVIGRLATLPLFNTVADISEDCLSINIHRPAGTTADSNLPVLFWIFGGGFEVGWNSLFDGAPWTADSITGGKPVIFVSVAYRVGGFGFLAGKELMQDGSTNLGLLDQRLGLQWVQDNIAAFGGNPDAVTIWGESAGAISVFYQLLLYDGDNTYNGRPLFRAAMMNSGSGIPSFSADHPRPQAIYDKVVDAAGCTQSMDTLNCLRSVDLQTFLNATNSVPALFSYNSVALSYLPRPDGRTLTASFDVLATGKRYAKVPFIIGDQEDEGTAFALFQSNLTTTADVADYLSTVFFPDASLDQISGLLATYGPSPEWTGSPFRTTPLENWYPQYKLVAAVLGDMVFTLIRRAVLNYVRELSPEIRTWSFLNSFDQGTPILGTSHGSDVLPMFFPQQNSDYSTKAYHAYYNNFVYTMDPNQGGLPDGVSEWPEWSSNGAFQLINMYEDYSVMLRDDFRNATIAYAEPLLKNFYF